MKIVPRRKQAVRQILMVGFDDAQILDISGPLEVFSRTSRFMVDESIATESPYHVALTANRRGPIVTSSGLSLIAQSSIRDWSEPIDTLIVSGGRGVTEAVRDRELIRWITRMAPRVRRLCSVCTGAFILAEAGLLNGRSATTHWRWCEQLAANYPKVRVETDPIFVRDGKIYTSAGVTAGIDLALALVEQDHGRRVALAVARELVMFLRRPGGQSQFSVQLATQSADREPLRELQSYIVDNPGADLSVAKMAKRIAMSPRNFARVFVRETGITPAAFVEQTRIESARRRLEESNDGIEAVASDCGFGTRESMRRAFIRCLNVAPSEYRNRFHKSDAA